MDTEEEEPIFVPANFFPDYNSHGKTQPAYGEKFAARKAYELNKQIEEITKYH